MTQTENHLIIIIGAPSWGAPAHDVVGEVARRCGGERGAAMWWRHALLGNARAGCPPPPPPPRRDAPVDSRPCAARGMLFSASLPHPHTLGGEMVVGRRGEERRGVGRARLGAHRCSNNLQRHAPLFRSSVPSSRGCECVVKGAVWVPCRPSAVNRVFNQIRRSSLRL